MRHELDSAGMARRRVDAVRTALQTYEGAGFPVRRSFPTMGFEQVDPFLALDHLGPKHWRPGEAVGAPDHPHRGFETVTYLLQGEMVHADSRGHRGRLGPGDVQWMTAGSGIVHSELPSPEFLERGGMLEGFQLWVNLPRNAKQVEPRYQEIPSLQIPVGLNHDGRVRAHVIAGRALGAEAIIETHTPITFVHFLLEHGASHVQPVDRQHNAFVYVVRGRGRFGADSTLATEGQIVLFERAGDEVAMACEGDRPVELLFIAGQPLDEPVARYGPFVMNTREEILEAIEDYQRGRMGVIAAPARP